MVAKRLMLIEGIKVIMSDVLLCAGNGQRAQAFVSDGSAELSPSFQVLEQGSVFCFTKALRNDYETSQRRKLNGS